MIEQNSVRGNRSGSSGNFFELTLADQSRRLGTVAPLRKFADDLSARARSQGSQFIERFLRSKIGRIDGHARFRRNTRSMVSRRLRPRGHCGSPRLPAPAAAFDPKFPPYKKCPFPLVCGIQHCLGRFSRTLAAAQSGIISTQEYSFHPSVPEAEFELEFEKEFEILFGPAASECEAP